MTTKRETRFYRGYYGWLDGAMILRVEVRVDAHGPRAGTRRATGPGFLSLPDEAIP